jgi:hypothetical protein
VAILLAGPAHAGFTLASVAADGGMPEGYYSGDHPALSSDGRFVAFRSGEAHLVSPATSGNQIFLRDLKLGTTELVSQSDLGQYGNGSSDWPSVSNDGCLVAFESDATNLVTGDLNGLADVFVRDRCSALPTTRLVSVDSSGHHSSGESGRPAISGDGHKVAFWAYGSDLVATAPNAGQIYLRDLTAQTTILVSDNLAQNGKGGNYGTDCPAVSDDGTRIAFWSLAYDLATGDDYAVWDILLWDANASPHITKVSTSSAGVPQDIGDNGLSSVTCPDLSGNGAVVAWASSSTNLVSGDTNGVDDIFVKDLVSGTTQRASVSSTGAQLAEQSEGRPALSYDGTWVAFRTNSTVVAPQTGGRYPTIALHNRVTGETRGVAAATSSDEPALSNDLAATALAAFFASDELDPARPAAGVYVYTRNAPPMAVAALSATTPAPNVIGAAVTLDGRGSSDPDGDALTYTWTQLVGPTAVSFDAPKSATPTFSPTEKGTYTFKLVVSDGSASSDPAVLNVDVVEVSPKTSSGCTTVAGAGLWGALLPFLTLTLRRRRQSQR